MNATLSVVEERVDALRALKAARQAVGAKLIELSVARSCLSDAITECERLGLKGAVSADDFALTR